MSEQTSPDNPIEALGVSEPCLDALKKSGVSTIGQLVSFLEQIWGGRAGPKRLRHDLLACLDEIVDKLKEMNYWPENLDDE